MGVSCCGPVTFALDPVKGGLCRCAHTAAQSPRAGPAGHSARGALLPRVQRCEGRPHSVLSACSGAWRSRACVERLREVAGQ